MPQAALARDRLAQRLDALAARYLSAACQVFIAVGRLPIVRRFELRALKKLYAAKIGALKVGAGQIGSLKVQAAKGAA